MIEELRTLAEKATPGPWRVGNGGYSHGAEFEIETAEDDAIYVAGVPWGDKRVEPDIPTHHTAQANAALIVALVNNLPAILAAAEKLEVAKEALKSADAALREYACHGGKDVPCIRTQDQCSFECGRFAGDALIEVGQALAALETK
jgi:hypothetical protein